LQADGSFGVPAANHVEEPIRSPMDWKGHASVREKGVPHLTGVFFSRSISIRQGVGSFTPPLRSASFRVVHVVLGRRDREDLHAGMYARGGTDGGAERGAHAFGDAVRASPGGDLVSRSTLCGYSRSLRWYAFPAFFTIYRFAEMRAASRAMWRI